MQLFELLDNNTELYNEEFYRLMANECMKRNDFHKVLVKVFNFLNEGEYNYNGDSWKNILKKEKIQFDSFLIYNVWVGRGVREYFPAIAHFQQNKWKYPHFTPHDDFGPYNVKECKEVIKGFYECRLRITDFMTTLESSINQIERMNKKLRTQTVSEKPNAKTTDYIFQDFIIERKAFATACKLAGQYSEYTGEMFFKYGASIYNRDFIQWFNKFGPDLTQEIHNPSKEYWFNRFTILGDIELEKQIERHVKEMPEWTYDAHKEVILKLQNQYKECVLDMIK